MTNWLPQWLQNYQRQNLSQDVLASIIVAVVLVPQAMAYAMLAGLPPIMALYGALLPLLVYAWLGSSMTLAVGPVGLMSLMTGTALGNLGLQGMAEWVSAANTLALMVGGVLLVMRLARLGAVINYLSHPVMAGFMSASAIWIALSQLKHLLGLDLPVSHTGFETLRAILFQLHHFNLPTAVLGVGSLLLMLWFRKGLLQVLLRWNVSSAWQQLLSRSGPVVAIGIAELCVLGLAWHAQQGVAIVGSIPSGLPQLMLPSLDGSLMQALWPSAVLIAFVGYFESVSIAKAMATRRRMRILPNQELTALGACNIASALSGGFAVAGGFGRSMVNFSAGAQTPLASMLTALWVALTLIFLTPAFYYLPQAVLAAIIILAVLPLIDFKYFRQALRYDRTDAFAMLATFVLVLLINVEGGIVAGVVLSVGLYLHRSSQPHIAVVGRIGQTEHYRNIERHSVSTVPHVLAIRVDENLYFANTNYLEDAIMQLLVDHPDVRHVVLICSSISFIDSSALESLDNLVGRLEQAGVIMHFAEVKGPVMDRLRKSDFLKRVGEERIFLSTHQAMMALEQAGLAEAADPGSDQSEKS